MTQVLRFAVAVCAAILLQGTAPADQASHATSVRPTTVVHRSDYAPPALPAKPHAVSVRSGSLVVLGGTSTTGNYRHIGLPIIGGEPRVGRSMAINGTNVNRKRR